mmetsp:Transcript_26146/g.55590  ORF Transcript_26146/g.55590 Transcript_26146/m.55590 type:complete len:115 (+) Transcript_26146:253-597(+)
MLLYNSAPCTLQLGTAEQGEGKTVRTKKKKQHGREHQSRGHCAYHAGQTQSSASIGYISASLARAFFIRLRLNLRRTVSWSSSAFQAPCSKSRITHSSWFASAAHRRALQSLIS